MEDILKKNGRVVVIGLLMMKIALFFHLIFIKYIILVKGQMKYYFSEYWGPDFIEFGLFGDLFNKKSSRNIRKKDEANQYFTYFEKDYEINGGEEEFQTEELEVFKII